MHARGLELLSKRSGIVNFPRRIAEKEQTIDTLYERIMISYKNRVEINEKKFSALCGKLSTLSPLAVFERGYCAAQKDGKLISSIKDITIGDTLTVKLTDGEFDCNVTERRNKE